MRLVGCRIFDAVKHPHIHWSFTAIFVVGSCFLVAKGASQIHSLSYRSASPSPPSSRRWRRCGWSVVSTSLPPMLFSITASPTDCRRHSTQRKHLRRNAIIKLMIVTVAIAGAITFGAT
jgi:hypothetical protein